MTRLGTRVITIQTAMLVALGFLTAGFVVLLFMPLYRRRAERLAIEELKRKLPMNEAEIRADKDRLRAEYAIRIHQLESRVDDAGQQAARQRIELNRRDGMINGLESEIAKLRGKLEEHENARRVLEQTITDRLPKVEQRLVQARLLLDERDQEIERLTRAADLSARALDETKQINAQQRSELERANAALTTRSARNREQLADPNFDGEVALRSEIEALRSRSREQSDLIARLQGRLSRGGSDAKASGEGAGAGGLNTRELEREVARLKAALASAEAEIAAKAARPKGAVAEEAAQKSAGELRAAQLRNEELTAEVARLKASLGVFEAAQKDQAAIADSRVAMKARVTSLEAEIGTQGETISSLRAELTAANERLARQAAHYQDQLRRMGAGTQPVSGSPRATQPAAAQRRPSLADRMSAPRPVAASAPAEASQAKREPDQRAPSHRNGLSGHGSTASARSEVASGDNGVAANDAGVKSATASTSAAVSASASASASGSRRTGLLDRISNISKTSS